MTDFLRVECNQYVWFTSRDVLRAQSTFFQGYCPAINDESGIWKAEPFLNAYSSNHLVDLQVQILDWICQPAQKPNESTPEYHARILSYEHINLKQKVPYIVFAQKEQPQNHLNGIRIGITVGDVKMGRLNLSSAGIVHGPTHSKIAFMDDTVAPFSEWERLFTLLRRWDLRVLETKLVHWMYQNAWHCVKLTDLLLLEHYFGKTCPVNGFIAKCMSVLLVREMQPAVWRSRRGTLLFHNQTTHGLDYAQLDRSPSWHRIKDEFMKLVLTEGVQHMSVEEIYAKFPLPPTVVTSTSRKEELNLLPPHGPTVDELE